MNVPPLANLTAIYAREEAALAAWSAELALWGSVQEVWRPAAGWVVGVAPLPGGEPDGPAIRREGLVFAEGRSAVEAVVPRVATLSEGHPQHLARLAGDFGFIRFGTDGGATVVRSAGGLVPFYLWHTANRTIVATRLTDMARCLGDDARPDGMINALWTTGFCFFPDGRSLLANVRALARGTFTRIDPARRVTVGVYWDPRPARLPVPTQSSVVARQRQLRETLVRTLTTQLAPEEGNLLTLSGGVDSSALLVLASACHRPVWTWSLVPRAEVPRAHAMSYLEPLIADYGVKKSWIVTDSDDLRLQLLSTAPPVVCHVIHPALCDLPRVAGSAAVRVLVGGEFADEVCGSRHTLPDWAAHTSFSGALRASSTLPFGSRDRLRWVKHRLLGLLRHPVLPFPSRLPELARDDLRAEYTDWLDRRRRAAIGDDAPLRHLALRCEHDGFLAMNWEATTTLGIRRVFPFFHREILELAFSCHPTELVGPGPKRLLRNALGKDVPARYLERPDKGHVEVGREPRVRWVQPLPDALANIVRRDWFPLPPHPVSARTRHAFRQLTVFANSLQASRGPTDPRLRTNH